MKKTFAHLKFFNTKYLPERREHTNFAPENKRQQRLTTKTSKNMKCWKVLCNWSVWPFTEFKFFEKKKDAIEFIESMSKKPKHQGFSAKIVGRKRVTLTYHHRAMRRGYIGVERSYTESYKGRFGSGFILHRPTKECRSNQYHVIEYYIES